MDRTGIGDKVAVVTGAAQGIGAAVATALAEFGAEAPDTHLVALMQAIFDRIDSDRSALIEVSAHGVDVADSTAVTEVIDRVEREVGPIDILVNVAGVLQTGTVQQLTDEEWQRTFAVNTTGVFNMCRAVAKRMVPRRRGAIVTVSSNAAGVPRHGMSAYAASKAAATSFTKCLGLELAEYGIRCNVVAPGSTDTAMLQISNSRVPASAAFGSSRTTTPSSMLAMIRSMSIACVALASSAASLALRNATSSAFRCRTST